MGLRTRLLLVLIPVLGALFAFDSWSDMRSLGRELQKAYDQSLMEPVQAVVDHLAWDTDGRPAVADAARIVSMLKSVGGADATLRVQWRSPDGQQRRVLLGPSTFPEPPATPGRVAPDVPRFYGAVLGQQPLRVAAMVHEARDAAGARWPVLVQAARDTRAIDRAERDFLRQSLWRDARMVAALLALVWLGIAWGLRPLRALQRAVTARSPHDLLPLAATAVPGEVVPLVDALNQHLAQQRKALDEQRQFLADASHQLRTPLAVLHTQAGYALREPDPAEVRRALQDMQQQLQRSRRVCEQLLMLAHAGQAPQPGAGAPRCDANAIARQVVLEYLPLAHGKQIDLGWCDARGNEAEAEDDEAAAVAPVRGTPETVHEALANLVHNAIIYTPAQGQVSVSARLRPPWCELWVQDNGPGIAPQDRPRAFERFERLADRRTARAASATVPGSGLGLSIAQALVQRMDGQIELLDGEHGVGLSVCVRLPLAASPSA